MNGDHARENANFRLGFARGQAAMLQQMKRGDPLPGVDDMNRYADEWQKRIQAWDDATLTGGVS